MYVFKPSVITLCVSILGVIMLKIFKLSVIMLSVIKLIQLTVVMVECQYDELHYTICH
jgi:hypothetical protein